MSVPILDQLHDFPYRRLRELLGTGEPPKPPILAHLGEPQGAPPAMLAHTVQENAALWSKYPPLRGTDAFRHAVKDWADRRFDLPEGFLDADSQILPACGTREALFHAALYAAARKRDRIGHDRTPAICLPNPLYHVYFGGALLAYADVVPVDATADNNFVPAYEDLTPEVLDRTALVYLCNPGNPTGSVAALERLKQMVEKARVHDFILAIDECYSELWYGTPPPGGLEACRDLGAGLDNVMLFNSLSKRSSAPGLRCGIVIGAPDLIDDYAMQRGYGGAQVPGPLMAAATALWRDEVHVAENRAHYAALTDIADQHLGHLPGYRRPEAAFFLWLNVAAHGLTGEEATRRLWQEQGVKTIPGRYMSRVRDDGTSPGDDYIRVALVHDAATTEDLCARIAETLDR